MEPRILTTSRTSRLRFTGASVALKLMFTMGGGVLLVIGALSVVSFYELRDSAVQRVVSGLLGVTRTLAPQISVDDHLAVAESGDSDSDAFRRMRQQLAIAAAANDLRYDQLYTFALNKDGSLRFVAMLHDDPFVGQNYHVPEGLKAQVGAALSRGTPGQSGIFEDAHGSFVSAFAPIQTTDGRTVGLVWADHDVTMVLAAVRKLVLRSLLAELGVAAALIVLTLLVALRLRRRLRLLVGGMRALRDNNEPIAIQVRGTDELAEVANVFNELSKSVHERSELSRYVPEHARSYVRAMVEGRLHRADEQRRITAVVMFTDIRGFTGISERLAPEDVVAIANRVFEVQSAVISELGGRVDKFLGDGVLAVFEGARKAERALRAAAIIEQRIHSLGHEELGGKALEIGFGMTLGEVVEGTIGSEWYRERSVLGAQVNLAARLCSQSRNGWLLVSGALFEQVRGRLRQVQQRPVELKGIENINAYAVSGAAVIDAFSSGPLVLPEHAA